MISCVITANGGALKYRKTASRPGGGEGGGGGEEEALYIRFGMSGTFCL